MKKGIRWGLYGIFVVLFFFIFAIKVKALDIAEEYHIFGVGETVNFTLGDFYFENIKIDFEETFTSFGKLEGTVINSNLSEKPIQIYVSYYDINENIIGECLVANGTLPGKESPESTEAISSLLFNSCLYSGNKDNDYLNIKYLKIEIKENNNPSVNNTSIVGNGEYALTKYKIDIKVNENNTFFITEYITADFYIAKHGIFRKLPLRNEVERLDGTKSYNRVKITEIKTSEQSTTYNESGYKVIKIGDPNKTLNGSKDYVITYLYNIGKDPGKGYDEFYFNLLGYEWDTTISGIEFTITMPKDFDKSKLGFSSGPVGSTDNSNIIYNIDGKVITGTYNGTLRAGEAITVRLELPDAYFIGASNNLDLMMLIAIILPLVFAGFAGTIWYRFGKDDQVIETVEFYPPEGFNSAEIGFLYKGKADSNDVVSLLIYLANQGYIKIEETEEKVLFSKNKGFKIIKVKEYDGNNPNERLFLNGLFNSKIDLFEDVLSSNEVEKMQNNSELMKELSDKAQTRAREVRSEDLYDSFYITLNAIVASLNNKDNKEKIFEKDSLNKNIYIILMVLATFILITFKPVVEYGGLFMLPFALLFPGIGFTILFLTVFSKPSGPIYVNGKATSSRIGQIIFGILFSLPFGGIAWAFIVLPALLTDPMYLLAYAVGIVCIIFMLKIVQNMKKRTPYGNEILGKIKGFRNFLETAEKPRLEELVMQNPAYFYNILPFTYVLGVFDKWINKFESIALQAPDWYSGDAAFDMITFSSFMSSTMSSASSDMSSSPSSSSDSGGGSSGGGSGGGGGGSW